MINKVYEYFQRIVASVLMLLMAVIIIFMMIDLVQSVYQELFHSEEAFLTLSDIFRLLGSVLMVLIAIELMASVHLFFKDKKLHLEVMFLIAITAVTRKIVLLDSTKIEPLYLIGIAAILAALIAGYYSVQKIVSNR